MLLPDTSHLTPVTLIWSPVPSFVLSCGLLVRSAGGILEMSGCRMNPEDLTQLVSDLSPAEQSAVREFISFLRERNGKSTSFQAAIDEFIAAHPELLRRLAQ